MSVYPNLRRINEMTFLGEMIDDLTEVTAHKVEVVRSMSKFNRDRRRVIEAVTDQITNKLTRDIREKDDNT